MPRLPSLGRRVSRPPLKNAVDVGSAEPSAASRAALGVLVVGLTAFTLLLAVAPLARLQHPPQWLGPASWPTLSAYAAVWMLTTAFYWWPRRHQPRPFALVVGLGMTVASVVLGLSAYAACSEGEAPIWSPAYKTMALFVGNVDEPFGNGGQCPAVMPLSLQAARVLALSVTLGAALAALLTLFVEQADRVRVRLARSLILVTGTGEQAVSFVAALLRDQTLPRSVRIVVVDPDRDSTTLKELRQSGAFVLVERPWDADSLGGAIRPGRAMRTAYLLADDSETNFRVASTLSSMIEAAPPAENKLATSLVVRVDDYWHAEEWRRLHIADTRGVVMDTIGTQQVTARALLERAFGSGTTRLILLGSTSFALAVLDELAQQQRERAVFGAVDPIAVVLIGDGADDLASDHAVRQEWFGNSRLVDVTSKPERPRIAVVLAAVADTPVPCIIDCREPSEDSTRLAQQVATRIPNCPVLFPVHGVKGVGLHPVTDRLRAYGPTLLEGQSVPEHGWMRLARHLHERYLAEYGVGSTSEASKPWKELSDFYRMSNYRAVTTTMALATQVGRTWAPVDRTVSPDPLTEDEVKRLAEHEHKSWCRYYTSHGWRSSKKRDDASRKHDLLVPWQQLGDEGRTKSQRSLSNSLDLLQALGYRPFLAATAPLNAQQRRYRRAGLVRAERLQAGEIWLSRAGDQLQAKAGDWRVTGADGNTWSITDDDLKKTYEHVEGDEWRRTGSVLARPADVGEQIRSSEGDVTALAGAWVVTDDSGNRWVVPGDHFAQNYAIEETSD